MSPPSIRRSLLIRCGAGVGLLLCMLSTGIYLTVRHGLFLELDRSIEQTASLLADLVELENEQITYEWQEGMGTNKTSIDSGLFQFWDESTGFTTRSPGLQNMNLPKFSGKNGEPLFKDIKLPHHGHARAIGMRILPFVLPEELERMKAQGRVLETRDIPHILVVARDTQPVLNVLERMQWILATGTLLTLAVVFTLIHRAIELSLKPIDILSQQVSRREGRHQGSPLDLPSTLPVELGDLARNFNSLLERMATVRERESDFIRHAAHELRTPIAELLASTDLALSQPRENACYQSHLENCRKTALDLGLLVNRLSALAHSDSGYPNAVLGPVDLAALTGEWIARFQEAFDRRGLQISKSFAPTGLEVFGDRVLLITILNNLLDNAACYASPGSTLRIRIEKLPDRTHLAIANAAEDLPRELDRLFDPLFRHDAARNDQSSHLGIGLTLSRNAAAAMEASLTAHRSGPHEVEFVLSFPHTATP